MASTHPQTILEDGMAAVAGSKQHFHNSSITQSEQQLRAEVTNKFQQGIYLLPCVDHHWVQGTLSELLKRSNPYLQQWLKTVQAIQAQERCRHGGAASNRYQKILRAFLGLSDN